MQEEKIKYYINLVDDFLDGKISASANEELQAEIKANSDLKRLVEEQIEARANIRIAGEKELKKKFQDRFDSLEENKEEVVEKPQTFTSFYFFAFILVALILAAMYFLNSSTKSESPELIASDIANIEDPSYDLFRSNDSTSMSMAWDKAVAYFAAKDYKEAIGSLEGLTADSTFIDQHSGKLSLMKGVSYMKLQQFEASERELNLIRNTNPYYDQAEWYLALTYFHSAQNEKAIRQFTAIKNNPTHFKRVVANEYVESLKNN